jgi:hypothetical protein
MYRGARVPPLLWAIFFFFFFVRAENITGPITQLKPQKPI